MHHVRQVAIYSNERYRAALLKAFLNIVSHIAISDIYYSENRSFVLRSGFRLPVYLGRSGRR